MLHANADLSDPVAASAAGQVNALVRQILTSAGAALAGVPSRLGLENLPGRVDHLAAGMLYSVACDQQAVRLPLLAGALQASLQAGKMCALVTPSNPAMLLRKARLAGFALGPYVKGGHLAVFQVAADAAKQIFRSGPECFLTELEQNFPCRGGFVVLDQADPLFLLSDPRAAGEVAHCYLAWVSSREHTVLATFSPTSHAAREYLALRQIAENFAGFAVAKPADAGAALEIRHWFGAEGVSPRESFALRAQGSGKLSVRGLTAHEDDLPPVDSVTFVRGAMDAATAAWPSWHEAESIIDAVDAARRSDAGTFLLAFQRPADYDALCHVIATIRALARPYLRIVVRERGKRLRASQSLALLRLGVSSIIPTDLSDTVTKRMIDALRGTRFVRAYDADVQQVKEETTVPLGRAIGSAPAFCEAVEGLMAAADGFDIDHCLVRLQTRRVEPARVAALAQRLGRDLLALAQPDSVWLFFFGCSQGVTPAILRRLFTAPLLDFCASSLVEHDPERILAALHALRDGLVPK